MKRPPKNSGGFNVAADFAKGESTPEWRSLMARLLSTYQLNEEDHGEQCHGYLPTASTAAVAVAQFSIAALHQRCDYPQKLNSILKQPPPSPLDPVRDE